MQTRVSKRWPLSGLCADMLASAVGRFLRTHRDGEQDLRDFMAATPPDRTEEEFAEERRQAKQAHEAALERTRRIMLARERAGLPIFDEALLLVKATGD